MVAMATYTLPLSYSNQSTQAMMASFRHTSQVRGGAMTQVSLSTTLQLSWQAWCQIWGSEIVATGILILVLDLLTRLPRKLRKFSPQEKWSELFSSVATDFFLVLDSAVEYPLFFAFHPVTLNSIPSSKSISFPTPIPLLLQVTTFIFVEYTFSLFVLRRISFPPKAAASAAPPSDKALSEESSTTTDEAARLAMEFWRPRGALLLTLASPAVCPPVATYCGAFHPLSVVIWATLRQVLMKGLEDSVSAE